MSVIDSVIILFLLLGAVLGFKRGVIKSVISLVGTILVIVLSFTLKDPISVLLYTYLPFFNIGIPALNILIYEAIAFLIVFAVLMSILKVIIKLSGLIEMILKFTIVLSIPSKILGAIFGFIEYYIFAFIILFILAQLNVQTSLIMESKLANKILSNTPVMSSVLEESYEGIKELVSMNKNNKDSQNKNELNEEALKIMVKYNIISQDNVDKLIDKGKLSEEDFND
jgi:uncharacterized membrane protein required for colicin V production